MPAAAARPANPERYYPSGKRNSCALVGPDDFQGAALLN